MSIAKKCDICGKLYEVYNEEKNEENTNGLMFLNLDCKRDYYSHEPIDCCPECMESIREHVNWLKDEKKPIDLCEKCDDELNVRYVARQLMLANRKVRIVTQAGDVLFDDDTLELHKVENEEYLDLNIVAIDVAMDGILILFVKENKK